MYTDFLVDGILRDEFVDEIHRIYNESQQTSLFWELSYNLTIKDYSLNERSSFIPFGCAEDQCNFYDYVLEHRQTADRAPINNRWIFTCSLKNYSDTIEEFLEKVAPLIFKSLHYKISNEYNDNIIDKIIEY